MLRRRVVVHGLVQGVFFRDTTQRTAERHGVRGWVANRGDGTVEAVFEGDDASVGELVQWVHAGPPGAKVERVEIYDEVPERLSGFEIR